MVRQAFRRLLRSPGFTIAALLLVAVAVAANATAFSALYALAWKPLPYRDGERLVELRMDLRDIGIQVGLSELLYRLVRADAGTFSGAVGATALAPAPVDTSGREWRVQRITHDFASVLGNEAALGRTFVDSDAVEQPRAIVLSERAWRVLLDGDARVLESPLRLGTQEYTVVGVMPRDFGYPDADVDAWLPYVPSAAEREQDAIGGFGQFIAAGRLAPGATTAQAQASLSAALANADAFAGLRSSGAKFAADARSWRERYSAGHVRALAILQLAVVLLLLVVAANLANLVSFRFGARQRELAVLSALGARARDLRRAAIAELAPLMVGGLAIGLALAPLGIALLRSRGLVPASLTQQVGGDWAHVLVAFATVAILAVVAVLCARATDSRGASLGDRLRIRSTAPGGARRRAWLMAAQVAMSTALVGSAGLLLRSASNLVAEDRGFDATGVLLTSVDLSALRGPDEDDSAIVTAHSRLRSAISALPGVDMVALADSTPFGDSNWIARVRTSDGDQEVRAYAVSPGYFAAMGIALSRGREFVREDGGEAAPVIVDERFRRRWLPDADPLAGSVRLLGDGADDTRNAAVVAIAPTVKHNALDEAPGLPSIYLPSPESPSRFIIVTRSAGDPAALVQPVRRIIQQHAPDALVPLNTPLQAAVALTLANRVALLQLVGLFAVLAVLLAGLGLYAALGIEVRARTAELGVRIALGATRARIVRMVMVRGGALIAVGVAVGAGVGIPLARLLSAQMYKLQAFDVATWSAAGAVVALLAACACLVPAWRASSVAPGVALRGD